MVAPTLPKTQNPEPRTRSRTRFTAVVLASGGLDSCVAAAVARRDYDLALLHANYGQRSLGPKFWGPRPYSSAPTCWTTPVTPTAGPSILRPSTASSSWAPGPKPTLPFTPL